MGVWHGASIPATIEMKKKNEKNGSMVELNTINLFTAINYTATESIYDNTQATFQHGSNKMAISN